MTARPYCSVESPHKMEFQEGTVLHTWNLKVYGLKTLAARLLIISDGKVNTVGETSFTWNKWEPEEQPASGQLMLLIEDGDAFGDKGKLLPSLSLDLLGCPPYAGYAHNSKVFLEADLQSRLTSSWSTIELGNSLLYSQIFGKPGDQFKEVVLGKSLQNAIAVSKGGRTVLVVELEARPRD